MRCENAALLVADSGEGRRWKSRPHSPRAAWQRERKTSRRDRANRKTGEMNHSRGSPTASFPASQWLVPFYSLTAGSKHFPNENRLNSRIIELRALHAEPFLIAAIRLKFSTSLLKSKPCSRRRGEGCLCFVCVAHCSASQRCYYAEQSKRPDEWRVSHARSAFGFIHFNKVRS